MTDWLRVASGIRVPKNHTDALKWRSLDRHHKQSKIEAYAFSRLLILRWSRQSCGPARSLKSSLTRLNTPVPTSLKVVVTWSCYYRKNYPVTYKGLHQQSDSPRYMSVWGIWSRWWSGSTVLKLDRSAVTPSLLDPKTFKKCWKTLESHTRARLEYKLQQSCIAVYNVHCMASILRSKSNIFSTNLKVAHLCCLAYLHPYESAVQT